MITAIIDAGQHYCQAVSDLWQWDYGQTLRIQGVKLPAAVEVQFSTTERIGETVTRIGVTKEGVTEVPIPDTLLEGNGASHDYVIYAFIYVENAASGKTEHKIAMNVRARPKPEAHATPEEGELFRQAIATVSESADRAESARDLAGGSARTAQGSAEIAEQAKNEAVKAAESIKNTKVPTKTSELENDSHFLTADTEISWGRKADTTIGEQSVALGVNVEASGYQSHAEGYGTTASDRCSHAEGYSARAESVSSHAEGMGTTASGYSSHAEGMSTTASGKNSHAEGYNARALSYCSHAEGLLTTASGEKSHAEGNETTASGKNSHAEGNETTASGLCSHAEGERTRASGVHSHAEGSNTTASGKNSHAEGSSAVALGYCSHAEGEATIARGNHSHVQGIYNVEDINNKYAHIVGNGTGITARKNIHTLDWKDNAEYAGDVAATVNEKRVSMSTLADIFLQPGAAAHNAICRGKKLGNALTSAMLASIRDGSFNDLYVCDYIETEDNIYRFMDFDYFLGCCSSASGGRIEKHHAILVPDKVMSSSAIDNYPEATQPKETHMYVNKLPEITQTLKGIFGNDNVAMMDRVITKTVNGESTGWDWVNVGADLLTEVMVMGHSSWGQWVGFQTGIMKGQLAGFRYSHSLMCSNEDYWLRDKRSATNYALISSDGYSSSDTGSLQHGVRPFFVIW